MPCISEKLPDLRMPHAKRIPMISIKKKPTNLEFICGVNDRYYLLRIMSFTCARACKTWSSSNSPDVSGGNIVILFQKCSILIKCDICNSEKFSFGLGECQ